MSDREMGHGTWEHPAREDFQAVPAEEVEREPCDYCLEEMGYDRRNEAPEAAYVAHYPGRGGVLMLCAECYEATPAK